MRVDTSLRHDGGRIFNLPLNSQFSLRIEFPAQYRVCVPCVVLGREVGV